jgi:hypothetical protein
MSGALYALKTLIAQHPSVAIPIARLRGHGVVVDRDTEVVIEGFPRSANSFAVAAFEMAQERRMRIAHHVHAPAQVLRAIALGVPAIVLIRDPEDAILSLLLAQPYLTADRAIRGYVRFYEPLVPHRHRFVVGAFPDVTTDFGRVISRLNELFGTSFAEFVHTAKRERAVFEAMEQYWEGRLGPGEQLERQVGRPSPRREELKATLRSDYRARQLAGIRARADRLYGLLNEDRA